MLLKHLLLILLHFLHLGLLCLYAMRCDMTLQCLPVTVTLRHDRVKQSIFILNLYHRRCSLCLVVFHFFTFILRFLLQFLFVLFEILNWYLALSVRLALLESWLLWSWLSIIKALTCRADHMHSILLLLELFCLEPLINLLINFCREALKCKVDKNVAVFFTHVHHMIDV